MIACGQVTLVGATVQLIKKGADYWLINMIGMYFKLNPMVGWLDRLKNDDGIILCVDILPAVSTNETGGRLRNPLRTEKYDS